MKTNMNSREKGKRGEREFAALLREHGFDARRGQQFAGGAESPDVVSESLPWLHIEVKRTQALNLADACAQAEGDSQGKPWVVAHRRNHAPWLITMQAELFFELVRNREWTPMNTKPESGRLKARSEKPKVGIPTPHLGINTEAWAPTQQRPTNEEFPAAAEAAAGSRNT